MYVYFTAFHFPGHPPTPMVPVYYTAITNKYPTPPTIQCTIQLLPVYYTAFTDKYPTPPINSCAEKSLMTFFLGKKNQPKEKLRGIKSLGKKWPGKKHKARLFARPFYNVYYVKLILKTVPTKYLLFQHNFFQNRSHWKRITLNIPVLLHLP